MAEAPSREQANREFLESIDPRARAVIEALDELLRGDPAGYSTNDLVQIWATLDYAHAAMRATVYSRPDIAKAMIAAVEATQLVHGLVGEKPQH